jgi:hypothetical protein
MISIEKTEIIGWQSTIRGMRNPMNSWEKSDSGFCTGKEGGISCDACRNNSECLHDFNNSFQVGNKDYELMLRLAEAGSVHAKYRRMITVYADITAPLYWWKGFDTYKVGTVANSCSTMHKIHEKEFTLEDFSCEHLSVVSSTTNGSVKIEFSIPTENRTKYYFAYCSPAEVLQFTIDALNENRKAFLNTNDKMYWWQMIQLLPSSYNQKRTIEMNYEVLSNIYRNRKDHKLDEWQEFCYWIEGLPHSKLITL